MLRPDQRRGILRFTDELIARVNRAGASGPKLMRADSGLWNAKVFAKLERAGWTYSIGIRMAKHVRDVVEEIDETAWTTITDDPDTGEAQIAETQLGDRRLIVRRTRLVGVQAELFPDWRHFPFLTNRSDSIAVVEAEQRKHAVVEAITAAHGHPDQGRRTRSRPPDALPTPDRPASTPPSRRCRREFSSQAARTPPARWFQAKC